MVLYSKVLCVGLATVDVVTRCDGYPEEDSDERCEKVSIHRGGNACNNCTILKQLGQRCEYLGTLGDDWIAKFIVRDLKSCQIDFTNAVIYTEPTISSPCSSVILNTTNGSRTIRHHNPNLPELTFQQFKGIIDRTGLHDYAWVHFEGRRRNLNAVVQMIDHVCSSRRSTNGIRTLVSVEMEKPSRELGPALLPLDVDFYFLGKDYVTSMGYKDPGEALYGIRKVQVELRGSARSEATPPYPVLVITWGERGSCALVRSPTPFTTTNKPFDPIGSRDSDNRDILITCPIYLRPNGTGLGTRVRDTLGAGDTFIATFIYTYHKLSGKDGVGRQGATNCHQSIVEASLKYASYVAGLKCGHHGLLDIPIPLGMEDFVSF